MRPGPVVHKQQRESAHRRGHTRRWAALSRRWLRDHPACARCGQPAVHTDHIDGLGPRGPRGFDPTNLQSLCASCHSAKTVRQSGWGWAWKIAGVGRAQTAAHLTFPPLGLDHWAVRVGGRGCWPPRRPRASCGSPAPFWASSSRCAGQSARSDAASRASTSSRCSPWPAPSWSTSRSPAPMITVMLASGQLLEARAAARARRELSLLVERAPRTARRHVEGGVVEVPVDEVVVGDRLLVGTGEIVPVDGRLPSARPCWTSPRSPGSRCRSSGSPATTSAAAWSTRGSRSTWSRPRRPPSPPTPGWCAWSSRPRPRRRRSSAPPTGSPSSSSRSRSSSRARPGRSAGTRSAPSPCSSSRRRARCCSPPRSRSCPGCPGPRTSASSSRAAAPWNAWPPGR